MIDIRDKSSCSGCSACEAVCAHCAIEMRPDTMGFLYPKVDYAKCVDCGLCERLCAFHAPEELPGEYPMAYAMRHIDADQVMKSKSGAAFVALSDVILNEGGIVYGAGFDGNHLVEHRAAETMVERDSFRGSKYIQSNLGRTFSEVKTHLIAGRQVIYTGTPCQIAGLRSYIGHKLADNLFLVDILCHGVASPAVWKDYLLQIEKRKAKKINRCIPRNPEYGWDHNIDTFIFNDGSQFDSDFFTGYVYHKWITQRWSCNVCPFTSLNRVSDITIGDAWGLNKVAPDFDKDNKGCSLVLINTEKGTRLFEKAENTMEYIPIDIRTMMQPVLSHPTTLHPNRQKFEDSYAIQGYAYVRRRYLNNTISLLKSISRRYLSKAKHLIIR